MAERKKIPIGIEDFAEIIRRNCYFVDKTLMIKDILDSGSKVTLFTRPRRFGKTLNMSMLQKFFEKTDNDNSYLFEGLNIMGTGEQYLEHMGQYPVISLSLKGMKQPDFDTAYSTYKDIIKDEFSRHKSIVYKANVLDNEEKERYEAFLDINADYSAYSKAIGFLSKCLCKAYNKNVIILIDEYDVPLENAYFNGFYDKMINLLRSAFESALKTNNFLEFAILTGCLRISKESIFTGLNNLKVYSVMNSEFAEYFGFTENEICRLAKEYGLEDKIPEMRLWYDGYLFGNTGIYNPWSVLQYVTSVNAGEQISCQPYWSNTSSNSIIYKLIRESGEETREMVEELMNGGSITVPIYEDTVYSDIDVNSEHIWSFLLFTGYLKQIKTELRDSIIYLTMVIPNVEVKSIYQRTIMQWFKEKTVADSRSELFNALISEDIETIEDTICDWLDETISFHDERENYYHGFLTGLLSGFKGYTLKSNRESGDGRPDLMLLERRRHKLAVIIEIKATKEFTKLEYWCDEALKQINDNRYETELINDGYQKIIKYGVAFCKKSCKVKQG
ncbi:MAG: ATP-binding protein [Ruminococcus flavefaciens]|nr:ATP-binding protein [Ruminococcus flavefaciens]MCM1228904.1 ATP-binding protein [Ruminococcus flavefaciens]